MLKEMLEKEMLEKEINEVNSEYIEQLESFIISCLVGEFDKSEFDKLNSINKFKRKDIGDKFITNTSDNSLTISF